MGAATAADALNYAKRAKDIWSRANHKRYANKQLSAFRGKCVGAAGAADAE